MAKKKKKSKNYYFTSDTEQAIISYANTECKQTREELYKQQIQPAFDELVDKIVYTYKFTSLENIDFLKDDCKIWLTTILGKFDASKGTKAFSYFSVVTKNWFTHKAKKQTQKNKREINYDDLVKELDVVKAADEKTFQDQQEEIEFWHSLMFEVESWDRPNLRENEKCVLNAVITLMKNIEQIEIFNKKAIYLYLREITGLNTKQIVSCLNKMRIRYRSFKSKWNNVDSLIEQALENIKNDRQATEGLLIELKEYMSVPGNQDRYSDSGPVAAKFVETLQRSNEQLVKLATLVQKKDAASAQEGLSDLDRENLFKIIKED